MMNVSYLWGGKGDLFFDVATGRVRASPYFGFDCSGLVTYAAYKAGGPDLRFTANTDALWNDLRETDTPTLGSLAFYGGAGPDVSHVMIVLGRTSRGEVLVFGASGGGSKTTTLEAAQAARARVTVQPTHTYRQDFRGFRVGILQS